MDFSYPNVCFNLRQLIEVLHCDLQVTIHQGLVEVQADILEVIANFVDNFHIKVTTLSAPQVSALLDHMCARHDGSCSFLAAIRRGTALTIPESFLWNGPTQLLQSFDRLPDHQTNIKRGSTCPTEMENEVNHFSKALQTCMVDVTSDPALILNFKSEIRGIPTINLTGEEAILYYPPLRGNIAQDLKDDLDVPTTAPGHSSHQHAVRDESFSSTAPSHTGSRGAPVMSYTLVLRSIPTDSLIINKKEFFPKSINRLKALKGSKENRTQTLIKVKTKEATTRLEAPTSQDEESYDGDMSEVDEEDVEVVPDKEDDAQMEGLKPAGADTLADNEETNKKNDGQISKPADKKPV